MKVINVYNIITKQYLHDLEELYSFLSTQERSQSSKFITSALSNNYIITRAVLRCILAKSLKIKPQEIKFLTNPYGKPSVEGSVIKFNMSHSVNSAYYGVSDDFDLGIDVEFFNVKKNIFDIAKSVFSTREFCYFVNLSSEGQQKFFFEAWTKKEAMIKALGLGLSYPMEKVDTLNMKNSNCLELLGERYYLYKLHSTEYYRAHLVIKNRMDVKINQGLLLPSELHKL